MWDIEEYRDNWVGYRSDDGFRLNILRTDYIVGVDPPSDESSPGTYVVSLTLGPIRIWVDEIRCDGLRSRTYDRVRKLARQKALEHSVCEVMVS